MNTESVLLSPRPLERYAGRLLLLPLLPHKPELRPLPSEIWLNIFTYVLRDELSPAARTAILRSLLFICKSFIEIVLPLLYSHVQFSNLDSLSIFTSRLHSADQKWDSIRRIPYSTPGRWVQVLDLSGLVSLSEPEKLVLDSLLTQLFPITPFLTRLVLNTRIVLSRRALGALRHRDGNLNLRALEGIFHNFPSAGEDDPFVRLLQECINLTQLDIVGPGFQPSDLEDSSGHDWLVHATSTAQLRLPHLHTLSLLAMHSSYLMFVLLYTPLPSLRKLAITPYADIPYPLSLSSRFLEIHGCNLRSLKFITPKVWPTRLHPTPADALLMSPNLKYLSLEFPLPVLSIPPSSSESGPHPLELLSIPKPNNDFWGVLDKLITHVTLLKVVRMRDVRWLRPGMAPHAREAGVQGEMRDWKRQLARRNIKLLDGDWKEAE